MPVYPITRYPLAVELRDGSRVTLRPMRGTDVETLLAFFKRVPKEERFLLKDDVTSPQVIQAWAEHLDYKRVLPLLATVDSRVIADAVLIRHRGGARSHLGEIRVVVDPEYRGRGLGVTMMRELIQIAYDAELEQVLFEFVKDLQAEAISAAEFLGAIRVAVITDLVKDIHGHPHDVIFLRLPLGKWWEWSQF